MTKHEVVAVAGEKTAIPCDCTPTSSHPGVKMFMMMMMMMGMIMLVAMTTMMMDVHTLFSCVIPRGQYITPAFQKKSINIASVGSRAVEPDFKKSNIKSDAQGACRRLYPTFA